MKKKLRKICNALLTWRALMLFNIASFIVWGVSFVLTLNIADLTLMLTSFGWAVLCYAASVYKDEMDRAVDKAKEFELLLGSSLEALRQAWDTIEKLQAEVKEDSQNSESEEPNGETVNEKTE